MHRVPVLQGHQRVVEAVRRIRIDDVLARAHAGADDEVEQLVGAVADEDVLAPQTVDSSGAIAQGVGHGVGIEPQLLADGRAQRVEYAR
jgi:hypothetical protein